MYSRRFPEKIAEVASTVLGPTIAKRAVNRVEGHDLIGHVSHEIEVKGDQGAGNPEIGVGPMPPLVSVGVDGDPIRMRVVDIAVAAVRVGARDDVHAELATSVDEVAEGVAVLQPLAAV